MNFVIASLAILGAAAVAVGAWLIFVPAGVITAGAQTIAAAYLLAYREGRRK